MDVFQLPAGPNLDDVDSVVALFDTADVTDNGNGTSTLQTQNFGTARNLCAGERFRDQPIGAFCSGFLVAPDIIATAGHCVNAGNVTNVRFVFGFRMRNATTAETVINNGEIYHGVAIIGRQEVGNGPDWALVRIDRPVTNHRIVRIRRTGRIGDTQAVHVIGHPSGLPTKFAGGAAVRNNQPNAFFVANLDTYGGNSGSPVFNSDTHEVEGILVRGETDFVQQGNCTVSLVCPTTGCRGEDCTRTTEFETLIQGPPDPWQQVSGGLMQISVGSSSRIWGVASDHTIWHFIGGDQVWQKVDGELSHVSVASDGDVWGVASDSTIWHFIGGDQVWQQVSGGLMQISVGSSSRIWGVASDHTIWHFIGGDQVWQKVDGELSHVSVASDGDVWGVASDSTIWHFIGGDQVWQQVSGGLMQISVGSSSRIWGVASDHTIWHFIGGDQVWQKVDGELSHVSVASDGDVWGVASDHTIWHFIGATP